MNSHEVSYLHTLDLHIHKENNRICFLNILYWAGETGNREIKRWREGGREEPKKSNAYVCI